MSKEKDFNLKDAVKIAINELEKTSEFKGEDNQSTIENIRNAVAQGNVRATSQLNELINLIVVTYNEGTILKTGMSEFVSQFIDKPNTNDGNGRRYIKHFPVAPKDFEQNKFIPDALDTPKFKVEFLKFKNDDGSLANGSIQKKWDIVYQQSQMITYFINNQLSDFIQEFIISRLDASREIFMYDYVMKHLLDVQNKGHHLNGNADNLFNSLVDEVFPAINEMKQNSSKFNVDQALTEAIDASKQEDLIMIVSPNVMTKLKSGIMSQTFNSANIDINNYVGQIHMVNKEFDLTTDTITAKQNAYVDDETIIIIDRKNYWRCINMLKFSGAESYATNMSNLKVLHEWFAQKHLGWGKVFVYKNPKLLVMP